MNNMISANYTTGAGNSYLHTYSVKEREITDTSFMDKVTYKVSISSEDMTFEEYKAYFNDKMNALYTRSSQKNYNNIKVLENGTSAQFSNHK